MTVISTVRVCAAALAVSVTSAGVATASAAPQPAPTPESLSLTPPGVSLPDSLAGQRIPAPQAALNTLVADGAVGVVAAIKTGTREQRWSAGVRRVWTDLPVRPNAKFRVASNTKTMVATLVMQQVEKGAWHLEDTIDEIAPGLVPGHGSVTIEQLLSHRSGMPDGVLEAMVAKMDGPFAWDEYFRVLGEDYADREIIAGALSVPWLFQPGTSYSYSNAGYVVLGQLLQRATGKSLPTLLEQRVFKPAGMTNSSFPTRPGVPDGMLVDAAKTPWRWYSLPHFNPEVFSAAGGTISTARDMTRFAKALNSGMLVGKSTLEQMRRPRTASVGYGLGIYRITDACRPGSYLYGHDGMSPGTLSLSFSSADASRQFSIGVSGRYYPVGSRNQVPYDLNAAALALVAATC